MKNMKAIQTDMAHVTFCHIYLSLPIGQLTEYILWLGRTIIDILNAEHPLDYPFSDSLCTGAENYKPVMVMII